MATNNFKPFAIGAGANVLSQAEYEALAALVTGFTSGKASSAQVNKALRQSTFIAASIAQFILNKSAIDVLDDGDLAGFVTDFGNALNKHSQPLDAGLTSLAALAGGANMLPYYTAADVFAQTSLTAIGRSLIGQTTQANALSYLGGAPLASPTFTGTPAAPTAAAGTSTTQIATTAFVQAVATLLAPLASPALTGTPTAPTATAGTSTTQIANTAFVGAAIVAATGRLAAIQKFTSSGTYTPTPGVTKIIVEMVGGGGGGGGAPAGSSTSNSVGGGGGSGAYMLASITSPAASYAITIGTGGAAGTTGQGTSGGSTTFGSLVTCGGGSGGYTGTASGTPNAAGGGFGANAPTATGVTVILSMGGGFGQPGYMISGGSGNGGNGASLRLGNGGFGSANGAGSVGNGYGSGGGGALTSTTNTTQQNGGAGAPGIVIIYEYY